MTVALRRTTIAWIFLSATAFGADLDLPVKSQIHLAVPGADQVRVIARTQADPELDVVVTLAGSKEWPPGQHQWLWWDKQRTLGIFLQRRDHAGIVYKIAVQKGRSDCELRVERLTATDLVVSCRPEKGDLRGRNYKFFCDIHSKALTGQLAYQPFSMPRLFAMEKTVVLVGSDRKRMAALRFDPLNDQIPFHLLNGSAAERWTDRAHAKFGLAGFEPKSEVIPDVPMQPFRTLHFAPDARFSLVKNQSPAPNTPGSGFTILEHLGKRTSSYHPLPPSTYDDFARLRPGRVRDGYTRAGTELAEEIGPAQVADGALWVAKTFYDDEGITGIGGLGFFDTQTKRYKMYAVPEIVDWSATAMLVEPGTVWIALSSRSEYRDISGGLLRFDRATATCAKLALPDLIYEMARVGDRLILATDFGVALVRDGTVRRFFVDRDLKGRSQLSEALPAH